MKARCEYPEFVDVINGYDIFCVSETKLDDYDVISLPNYNLITKHRKQRYLRKSGGIGVFVKDNIIKYVDYINTDSEYILWIRISKQYTKLEGDLYIGTIYVPPTQSRFYNDDDFSLLEDEITNMCSKHDFVFITGDANARTSELVDYTKSDNFLSDHFNFDEETLLFYDCINSIQSDNCNINRKSKDPKTNNTGYKLIDICKNNNLFILNGRTGRDKNMGKLTFRNQSLIDYTLATSKCAPFINDFDVLETDMLMSDGHSILQMTLIIQPIVTHNILTDSHTQTDKIKWRPEQSLQFIENISDDDVILLNEMLESCRLNTNKNNINEVTKYIADIYQTAARKTFHNNYKHQRFRDRKLKQKPWFGNKCRNARLIYNTARKQFQKTKSNTDKINLQHQSKMYKQTMNKYINEHKRKTEKELRKMNRNNPKSYWKVLNSLKPKDTKKKANLNDMYTFFKEVNSRQIDDSPDDLNNILNNIDIDDDDTILNVPFTSEEIAKAINNLNNCKTPGNDQILNEYIISTKDKMLPIYVLLFNTILKSGIIPDVWTTGTIMPIYKNKGDRDNPENYRPITILSCLGKLFTSVLNQRLNSFLDFNIILSENQAGFRKGYSTTDHIFVMHLLIELLRAQKKKIFCAFIDFSQAFDSVWRIGLWRKLLYNNIKGKFFRLIFNMYSDVKSCVTVNGDTSQYFSSFCGVKQGDNLSPVLFSLFLNDLELFLSSNDNEGIEIYHNSVDSAFLLKIVVLLYADDTVLLADNEAAFQKSLDDFFVYCRSWKLNINFNKTKVIVFGSRSNNKYKFKLGQAMLETVSQYKYLGVYFSKSGSYLNARKHIVEQAKKAMYLLYTRINNIDLPLDLQLKLFDHTIVPILTYGCEIWGFENLNLIERVHTDFLRKITKSRKSTPIYMLYAELGRYPLEIIIKIKMLGFWNRIISGKQGKLSYLLYEHVASLEHFRCKWLLHIKQILNETGNTGAFSNNTTQINKSYIKINLIDQYKQLWNGKMSQSSKAINYNMFKETIEFEEYFKCLPKHLYINVVKFRTSNHKLPIETGRWNGIERSERKCNLCNLKDIGDEFHYLLICPFLAESRKKYIKKYYYKRTNTLKFKELLNTNSESQLRKLSQFVKEIMKIFA